MSVNGSIEKLKDHGKQDILSSQTKSSDVTVEMDLTRESNLKESQEFIDYKESVDAKKAVEDADVTHITIDSKKSENIENELVKDVNKNNENYLDNTFITLRVYDMHYGHQQPPQLPHYQVPTHQQHGPQFQFDRDYGGGGGGGYMYEPGSRSRFVLCVFTILLIMLAITSVIIGICITTPSIRQTFRRHFLMFLILGICILLAAHYMMYCLPSARVMPCNMIVLGVAIAGYSILAGNCSAKYRTQLVLYAALATAAVVLVCLALACTKFDFTSWLLYVVAISTVFSVIAGIIFVSYLITKSYPKPLHIAILIIGTLILVVTLIIELQMILGGKSVELSEDDYALGAFMLYTSIMSLFMHLLQLMGYS